MEIGKEFDLLKENVTKTIDELIKGQEKLKVSKERYKIITEATNDIIWEGNLIDNKRVFYGKLKEILGYEPKELENMEMWFSIVHEDDIDSLKEGIQNQIVEKKSLSTYEYRVRTKDGNYKWMLSNTICEFNEYGEAISTFGTFSDITKVKENQKKIYDLAYHDSITGLPNRSMLGEATVEKIEKASREKSKFAMIFLDLDNFKFINDSYGHILGDKVLVEVGKRLKEIQNNKVMTFRLGGDDFVILIEETHSKTVIENYLKHIHEALMVPIAIDEKTFYITCSDGIVVYPDDGNNFHDLFKNADTALYKSKGLGKGTTTFYNSKMSDDASEKARIQTDLHTAVENEEFKIYYQPIVSVDTGRIKGCEALTRWIHPEHGLIPPDKFIGIAEENGTIIEIGKWIFKNACKYAKSMYNKGYTDFYVSINVSPNQLLQNEFVDFVLGTMKKLEILPEMIVIEITESVLIEYLDLAVEKLTELREHDIRIALDDFGCGYSSLTYLKRLPINILKIDRSFILDIQSEEEEKNMISIIILLAKLLDMKIVAEGVEFEHQLSYLKKQGCDMFQGYLISKPVPKAEFSRLMKLERDYHSGK